MKGFRVLRLDSGAPLRQEPEAPTNNATSRNCLLATARSYWSRVSG